jgi:methyl-accepting chemotaxis protein
MTIPSDNTQHILEALDQALAVAEFSTAGNLLHANHNYLSIFGYQLEQIQGWHYTRFHHEHHISSDEYRNFWRDQSQANLLSGQFCRKNSKGEAIWLEASYTAISDARGQRVKIIKFASEITASKVAANEQNMKLQALDRSMKIAEFSPDATLLDVNENFLHSFGYNRNEIIGKNHTFFCFPKEVEQESYQTLWSKLREGQFYSGLCERKNQAGERIWLEATYNPVYDPDGQLMKIIQFSSDITERVNKENVQNERVKLLSLVADGTGNAVLLTDADWNIIYVNTAFTRIFGYPPEKVLGKPLGQLLLSDATTEDTLAMHQALLAGQSQRFEKLT